LHKGMTGNFKCSCWNYYHKISLRHRYAAKDNDGGGGYQGSQRGRGGGYQVIDLILNFRLTSSRLYYTVSV